MSQRILVTLEEIQQKYVKIPYATLKQYARENRIPVTKVGKRYLADPDEVVEAIRKFSDPPAPEPKTTPKAEV
ncbi:MAG: helix-turn-helix domain-containing protein [Spirochaetia bacterium]|nr:helix-turn-helix domain-containing protein [Spirochaetia bacterium]